MSQPKTIPELSDSSSLQEREDAIIDLPSERSIDQSQDSLYVITETM